MKILDFIEKDGEGKYSCYKTKKLVLDEKDQDTLDYDDKPAIQLNSAQIAESDMSRKETVLINAQMMKLASTPLFSFFLVVLRVFTIMRIISSKSFFIDVYILSSI